jgi:hypothetical protein
MHVFTPGNFEEFFYYQSSERGVFAMAVRFPRHRITHRVSSSRQTFRKQTTHPSSQTCDSMQARRE